MTELTEDNVEAVLVDSKCRCGLEYMVLKIKGEVMPRVMHKKPACKEYNTMQRGEYLVWAGSTGFASVGEPTTNRKQRRADARRARRGDA